MRACVCVQTWDEGLAVTARAWARFCIFKHNIHLKEVRRVHPTFTSVGENIWAGTPYSSFKPESAVMLWNNEDKDYNYDTKQCSKVCGHYTQVQTQIQLQLNQILENSHKRMKPLFSVHKDCLGRFVQGWLRRTSVSQWCGWNTLLNSAWNHFCVQLCDSVSMKTTTYCMCRVSNQYCNLPKHQANKMVFLISH